MWPLKRKQPEPEQKTVSSGAGMFLPLGSGNFMARTSQQYAKEGYAEKRHHPRLYPQDRIGRLECGTATSEG